MSHRNAKWGLYTNVCIEEALTWITEYAGVRISKKQGKKLMHAGKGAHARAYNRAHMDICMCTRLHSTCKMHVCGGVCTNACERARALDVRLHARARMCVNIHHDNAQSGSHLIDMQYAYLDGLKLKDGDNAQSVLKKGMQHPAS